jgi:hypothetical protein
MVHSIIQSIFIIRKQSRIKPEKREAGRSIPMDHPETKISPELIYALKKTGMLVTAENISQWTAQDLRDYQAAIAEYRARSQKQ